MANDGIEIPVIVDIDGAFQDAANRIPQAIEPLERQISKHQLNVKVDVGTQKSPQLRKFKDLLNESQSSATQLERAINSVNKQIDAISKAGGFNPMKGLKASEKDLLALRAALEMKLKAGNFIDNAVGKIKGLASASRVAGQNATTAINSVNAGLRTQGGLWQVLTRYFSQYVSIFAGLRLIRNIRETTAEFEMQRVALAGIIQDATRANQLFGEIKAAAVQSPFQIKDLVTFTKQLSAYRIETDKLFDVTMRLADVSAGLGVDMNRLVLAYGQVRAASVLRGQELRQFTEAGIPLVELLAKKFSVLRGELVSTGEVFELISERAVPFSMIEDIFNDMTSAGGIFYEMQLKQSETLKGQWMKLKDVISIAYDEMGRSAAVNELMRGWIQLISNLVKNWERLSSVASVAIYGFIAYRAALKNLIPVYNMQQKAIARQIQMEKQLQIERIRLESRTGKLNKTELRRVEAIKKMTAEDYKRIFMTEKMSMQQAMLFYWRNKDNKEIAKSITETGILTKTQINAIKKMNWMQIHLRTWGSSLRIFFKSLGTAIASFWPIAAISLLITTITGLIETSREQKAAIKAVDAAYHEQEQSLLQIENAYNKIKQAIADVTDEEERAVKAASMFGQKLELAQKVTEALKKYGMGGDFDLSLLNTDNIDDFVDKWLETLNEANELTRDWGRNVAMVANAWEFSVLGIHLAGDNLKTDIKQLTNAYVKLTSNKNYRQSVNDMRNYLEYLKINEKEYYRLISSALGEEADLAVAQKRRNETEYEYQMRLIRNYERVRDQLLLIGAQTQQNVKHFDSYYKLTDKLKDRLDEVAREFDKTWGSFEGKDEITIKMAIDKTFAENQWEDWLKEAWIQRVNQQYQMNIQITPTIGNVTVPKGMKSIISTELEGLFTDQELENMNSVTEIAKAIEEKMKRAADAIAEADKLANNFANNKELSLLDQEKIKKAQIAIDNEMAKAEKDRNKDVIEENLAIIDAITKQNDVYREQILKKKESAKAEYELAKAAKERLLNENLSDLGKDIKQAFPDLMERNRIIDQMDLKSIGDKMKAAFPDASPDLLARPLVDAAKLVEKGWEDAGDGIATVFSSTFDFEDESGKHNILVTPILPDGTVLSPEELEEYVAKILDSVDIKEADTSKLVLGVDVSEDAGERLHEMQEEYYDLADRMKNVANRFLITEDDLKKIQDGADAYEIYEKNVKAIADAREKLAGAGVTDQTVAEEQARLDAEKLKIQKELEDIESRMVGENYKQLKAQHDSLRLAIMNARNAKERKKAEDDLNQFLSQVKFQEGAILILERQRAMENLSTANSALAAQVAFENTFKTLDEAEKAWQDFAERYNLTLKEKPKGGTAEDPWILLFKNRMKFMQDFEKGVDDMNKHLAYTQSLLREQDIMKGRGLSLGIKTEELLGTPDELRQWYKDAIKQVVDKIHSMGGREFEGLGVTEILAKDLTGRKTKKYQELLQELWKGLTDFDTDEMKNELTEAMNKVSEELKRSETARNFFKEILGMTGDEDIATNMTVSVYGDIGKEFKERVQDELNAAFETFDASDLDLWNQMREAIDSQDWKTILQYIDKFPKEWQKQIREMSESNEKFYADWLKDLMKTYENSKNYEERMTVIHNREEQKRKEINESTMLSPEQKTSYIAATRKKEAEDIAKVQLEAMKDTYTWTRTFDNLDYVSTRTLDNLLEMIDKYVDVYGKDLEPEQLKELTRAKRNVEAQKMTLNAYRETVKAIKEFIRAQKQKRLYESEGITEGEEYDKLLDRMIESLMKLSDGLKAVQKDIEWVSSITKDILSATGSEDVASYWGEQLDNISKVVGGVGKMAGGLAGVLTNPADLRAWKTLIEGVADAVVGIFDAAYAKKIKRLNEEIESQQKLLDSLEKSYNDLEKAMAKSFGSDYIANYNEQLKNLNAQVEAYRAQASLESQKGKKADQDKVNEYLDSAAEAQQQITDMQGQLAEFFTGTDLTSAARDFAQAWIDAYKEFGSTTDAMREKFQDMIQSMIEQSLGAKIMQTILQPLFDSIDEMAQTGGELTSQEIAQISQMAPEYIDKINNAMTNLMNSLAASGYNVRQGVGSFTGISRDIAGASEESITGLAAGINTQNFYMSLISQNVAAILQTMTGGEVQGATGVTVPDSYKETMLQQTAFIPQIHDDMYAVRALLEKVIKPNGTSATHYVATRM